MPKATSQTRFLALILLSCLSMPGLCAGPEAEIQRCIGIIREHIHKDYKGMFKPAKGNLKRPFITPGSSQYQEQLWDWDSWLADIALRQILQELRNLRPTGSEVSYVAVLAIVTQMVAVLCLFGALWIGWTDVFTFWRWLGTGLFIQLATIALLLFPRKH